MAKHDMGPSEVKGFVSQCRKCKALDTEIKFALGQECPVPDPEPETKEPEVVVIDPATMNWSQRIAWLQASWFHKFHMRQFEKAMKLRP